MRNKGITLIALVITIVVLIILAGITINLTLGENGILKKAEEAKEKENESSAREKLELVLLDANIEKQTNTNYNKESFLTQMLEDRNMTVEGDTVIVDNYVYKIDREKLEIIESLGESLIKLTSTVQEYLGANGNGKYEVSILLIVESNTNLQSVVIEKPDGTTFEIIILEGTKVAKDLTVELDETYIVTATTKDEKTQTRKIIEKSEENIKTVEELVAFRDKVNGGLTYEGKVINLANSIDLSTVCGQNINGEEISWEPIGTATIAFKGIFDGNRHSITNIYINTTQRDQGLFKHNYGSIRDLSIIGGSISASFNTGTIVGNNLGIIEKCYSDVDILNNSTNAGANGGIAGNNYGIIRYCFNLGNITKYGSNVYSVGGIVGVNAEEGKIIGCYNVGNVKGGYQTGGIAGASFDNTGNKRVIIQDCYNVGTITCTENNIGAITGGNGMNSIHPGGTVSNCYFLQNSASKGVGISYGYIKSETFVKTATEFKGLDINSTLGDAYVSDGKIKDKDGNWVDNKDEEGNIIYINNGYPILKWQVEGK